MRQVVTFALQRRPLVILLFFVFIALGIRSGDALEVVEGLNAGERVVTGGALFIDRAGRSD